MDKKTTQKTADTVDQKLMSHLAPLEQQLHELFYVKAPRLPKEITDFLVTIAPYITVLFVILGGIAILGLIGISILALPLWFFAAPATANATIYLIFTLVGWLLSLAAIPGLFARSKQGWNFVFYGTLWNALRDLLTLNLIGLVISLAISFYFLFQARPWYLPQLPKTGGSSAKTDA